MFKLKTFGKVKRIGRIETLILTNAAGSLTAAMRPGALMLITDHINFSGMNPLIGEHGDESFVPMTKHTDAHFYLEFEGDPEAYPCTVAIEELRYYTRDFEILGSYPKSPYRKRFINGRKMA